MPPRKQKTSTRWLTNQVDWARAEGFYLRLGEARDLERVCAFIAEQDGIRFSVKEMEQAAVHRQWHFKSVQYDKLVMARAREKLIEDHATEMATAIADSVSQLAVSSLYLSQLAEDEAVRFGEEETAGRATPLRGMTKAMELMKLADQRLERLTELLNTPLFAELHKHDPVGVNRASVAELLRTLERAIKDTDQPA